MEGPRRVLIICSANVCRSPVAERALHRAFVEIGMATSVRSAGMRVSARAPHPDTVAAAAAIGLDLTGHVPRHLTAEMVRTEGADLIIGLTREHLRHIVGVDRSAWSRTFTLKELARRAPIVHPGAWDAWLAETGGDRRPTDLLSARQADDVADPYGQPYEQHLAMVREVDELARCAAMLALPPA